MESFHFVRNGLESFLGRTGIKAARTWVVWTDKHGIKGMDGRQRRRNGGEGRAHLMQREGGRGGVCAWCLWESGW